VSSLRKYQCGYLNVTYFDEMHVVGEHRLGIQKCIVGSSWGVDPNRGYKGKHCASDEGSHYTGEDSDKKHMAKNEVQVLHQLT